LATKKAKPKVTKAPAKVKARGASAQTAPDEGLAVLAAVEQQLLELAPRFEELGARLAERVVARLEESGLLAKLAALATAARDGTHAGGAADAQEDNAAGDQSRACAEPGCAEPARARGLCSKHYQRQRYAERRKAEEREAGPDALPKRGGGSCAVEGCDQLVYARGMCGKHFMEWVRTQKKA
jgi:hypothetical protein